MLVVLVLQWYKRVKIEHINIKDVWFKRFSYVTSWYCLPQNRRVQPLIIPSSPHLHVLQES